jgi:hypothetical protein
MYHAKIESSDSDDSPIAIAIISVLIAFGSLVVGIIGLFLYRKTIARRSEQVSATESFDLENGTLYT